MKNFLLFIIICFSFSSFAQVQKYHRVKIETGENGLSLLAENGVAVDHGEYKNGVWFTGEFSEAELDIIKQSGLPYQVLIHDMASYYALRNNNTDNLMLSAPGGCKNCKYYPTPANFTLGTMGGFYTFQEMLDVLDSMTARFPNLISVRQTIDTGHTYEGRQLYYLKISDNPNVSESEPQVLYTALHHAREPESLSQLIYYMWYLLENYNSNADIKYLVDNLELYFVPCVNPDGYVYNHTTDPTGGGMWRKNRRDNGDGTFGVDLNRNYGYNWAYDNIGSSPLTSTDVYRGTSAFSEPETQMIRDFCNAHTFQLCLNNHTFSNVLIQPSGTLPTTSAADSTLLDEYCLRLTKCDGFTYGNGPETVGYSTNGVSDDWMYGAASKPKIYALTPEAGSVDDGFWPLQSNIIPIAENTMDQNIKFARLATAYGEVEVVNGPFIQQTGFIKYNIQRLGLQPGTFTVSIVPIGTNFQSVGSAKIYSGMNLLQSAIDSISYTMVGGIVPGANLQYVLNIDNGYYVLNDTINCIYGTPITIFSDACNDILKWNSQSWDTTSLHAVSPGTSITDSRVGKYFSFDVSNIITVSTIDLTTAVAAHLEYYLRWEIEKNWDYAEVQVSTNGFSFTPLCGRYTHDGNSYQDYLQPVYDGFQKEWVKESIDLSPYLGQSIYLRFHLVSDLYRQYDGFYFDDLKVKIINSSTAGIVSEKITSNNLVVYPNPSNGIINIQLDGNTNDLYTISISTILGEEIFSEGKEAKYLSEEISLKDKSPGTYFVSVKTADNVWTKRVIITGK